MDEHVGSCAMMREMPKLSWPPWTSIQTRPQRKSSVAIMGRLRAMPQEIYTCWWWNRSLSALSRLPEGCESCVNGEDDDEPLTFHPLSTSTTARTVSRCVRRTAQDAQSYRGTWRCVSHACRRTPCRRSYKPEAMVASAPVAPSARTLSIANYVVGQYGVRRAASPFAL